VDQRETQPTQRQLIVDLHSDRLPSLAQLQLSLGGARVFSEPEFDVFRFHGRYPDDSLVHRFGVFAYAESEPGSALEPAQGRDSPFLDALQLGTGLPRRLEPLVAREKRQGLHSPSSPTRRCQGRSEPV